jgi:hypothetical protein
MPPVAPVTRTVLPVMTASLSRARIAAKALIARRGPVVGCAKSIKGVFQALSPSAGNTSRHFRPKARQVGSRAAALALLVFGAAQTAALAATVQVQVLLDLDNNPSTGCTVTTSAGTFNGAEQVLTTTVDTTANLVTAVSRQVCTGGVLVAPIAVNSPYNPPWPIGPGNGTGGSTLIESYVPLSAIPASGISIRAGFVTIDQIGQQDAILNGILVFPAGEPSSIPTLSEWGLILLAALLAATALLVLRRGVTGTLVIILVALGIASVAVAAITLTGNPADWAGISPLATKAPGANPTRAEIYATYAVGNGVSLFFRIDVKLCPVITVSPNTLPDGSTSSAYPTTTFTQVGGVLPITWSESGALPSGMSFTGAGVLSGSPTQSGTFPITFTATDAAGCTGSQNDTLKIDAAPAITSANSATFLPGVPTTFTVTTTGFPTGASMAITETGSLPSGVTFVDNQDGTATISGSASGSGNFPITITAANGVSPDAVQSFTIKLASAPAITSANNVTFAPGKTGQTFNVTTTGLPTNAISRTGTLPSGVTFTDNLNNTATIAGTPTAGTQGASPYPWVITAANGILPDATQNPFTFNVVCPAITVSGTIPALTFNTAMATAAFTQSGGNGTITWSQTGLPAGTGINSSTGDVTGTPSVTGTFSVTITATDAGGCTGAKNLTVTVAPVAVADSYSGLVDNTQFVVTGGTTGSPATPFVGTGGAVTFRLTNNDLPSGGVTLTTGTSATTAGGSVTVAADGTFIYTPKANPTLAATTSDFFSYTISSNTGGGAAVTANGTATLTLAGRVWYVKNNGAAGNGQSQSPFQTLAAGVAASTANDSLFVYRGDGTTTNLATASILKSGQSFIGEGVALVVNSNTLVPAGSFPLIGNTLILANNVTINGIDMSTGSSRGITNLNGAYNTVTGVSVTARSVTSTTGTAVDIQGAGNTGTMTFTSVSASGGSNGIVLQNFTGGSFTVNGDGASTSLGGNSSGGTIANMSGADNAVAGSGIYLNNVSNVTLRRLTINGTNQNFGIRGNLVNGFTLEYSTVAGTNGTAATLGAPENAGEGSIYFGNTTTNGLSTSGTLTKCSISGGRARNVSIINTTAATTSLTIKGNTFGANQNFSDANQSLLVEARNSGTIINSTVGGPNPGEPNTFTAAPGDLVNFTGQTGTTMDVVFKNNTLSNNHAQNIVGGGGMTLATQGVMTFDVSNNSMRDANGSAVTMQKASAGTSMTGHFNNNTIGVTGVVDSGSKTGNGIFWSFAGGGTINLEVSGNTILQYHGNAGLYADNTGGSYAVIANVTNNVIAEPGAGAFAGIAMTAGGPVSSDTITVCANITGNDASAGDPSNANDIILGGGASGSSFLTLPGLVPTGTEAQRQTQVQNFVLANNNFAGTVVSAYVDAPATFASTFKGGAPCAATP